jgi:predicted signal transduction protein with EAL and GGDEF domain
VPFPIGASIGIATYPEDGRSATDLLAVADRGLYNAKAAGGNRVGPDRDAAAAAGVDDEIEAPIELGAHRRRTGEPLARPLPAPEPMEAPVQSSGA